MALPTYSTGTASVAAGGTVVTGVGCLWSGTNVKQGDFISIGGSDAALITEVTDTTHLKVAPWTAGAKTTQPYIIYQNYVGRVVGVAAAEDVGTMLEKLHTDGLPFIVDPSLTVPDPSYGDDGQMAFQPSTGKWWTKTGGVWVLSPGLSSDSTKVSKTGDTMTGPLTITGPAYIAMLRLINTAGSGYEHVIRMGATSELEIINSAFTSAILSLTDAGDLWWPGTAWTAYTPTVTGTGGAAGTATGRYKLFGKMLALRVGIFVTTGGATIRVSLPAVSTGGPHYLVGRESASTGNTYLGQVLSGSIIDVIRYDNIYTVTTGWQINLSGIIEVT